MTDLTIPTFLKRKKPTEQRTIDTPLSNIPSTPQAPEKAPKVIPDLSDNPAKPKVVTRFKKQTKPKSSTPRIVVKDGKPVKKPTPEAIRRVITAKPKTTLGSKAFGTAMAAMEAAASAGHLPVPPDVTDKSSAVFKKHRSDLIALVKAKDVNGLREYKMNADRVALQSYRACCIKALTHK